jgi:hypothetical protein
MGEPFTIPQPEAERKLVCTFVDWLAPAERIYLQFSDCGQHIRKWSRKPFEGARRCLIDSSVWHDPQPGDTPNNGR